MKVFCRVPLLLLLCVLLSSQRCRAFAPRVFAPSSFLRSSYDSASSSRLAVLSERSVNSLSKAAPPREPSETTTLATHLPSQQLATGSTSTSSSDYTQGFAIIAFITLLNASLSPVWHTVYANAPPPPLFLNAIVGLTAFGGLVAGGPWLDGDDTPMVNEDGTPREPWAWSSWRGGMELGVWKGLGTTCHIAGMALTTANHGAFLLQLTTLIVPVLQAFRGERLPRQAQFALLLALVGIVAFTQEPTLASDVLGNADPSSIATGDALVLGAAFFYSLYDIQTFYWGREVPRKELVTIKVGFQAFLSVLLCVCVSQQEVLVYLEAGPDYATLVPTVLWSGLIVNALATFLQVKGMQAVGPTRAQTIFASQPLWAAGMNYVVLGSVLGLQGLVGGASFVGALLLAATAQAPEVEATTSAEPTKQA